MAGSRHTRRELTGVERHGEARGEKAAQEGWAWQGRRRERDAKNLWQQPRRRRGAGGSSGATSTSFKPATSDDAATRSSPAGPLGDCRKEERRGGAWRMERPGREVGGKPGEAGARETAAAARGRAAPAALQARACALHGAAPRPPATWAWPQRPRARPPVGWEPGVSAVDF